MPFLVIKFVLCVNNTEDVQNNVYVYLTFTNQNKFFNRRLMIPDLPCFIIIFFSLYI